MRAISFSIVFFAHVGWGNLIPGGFGVTVFFFLSGYLITTLMRMEFARTQTMNLRDFYLRRVLRILPPFYTVLLFAILLTQLHVLHEPLQPGPTLAQVFHFANFWEILHGTAGQAEGTGVYWSLAVEEHFYFLFPLLFLLLQRLLPSRQRAQALVLLGLCAVILAWRFFLVLGLHTQTDRTYLGSDTRFDSILFGCALAVGANPMLDQPRVRPALTRYLLLPLGVLALLASFLYRADWFRETLRYTLQGVALAPIFVVAMREPGFLPMRFLNLRFMKRLGVLSYSLYLVHHVVIYALPEKWGRPLIALLAYAISLLLAEIIHRFIEKPCARLRNKLEHQGRPPLAMPVAQAD